MYRLFLLFCFCSFSNHLRAQSVQVVNFDNLQKHFYNNSDTTYVVNFFASWCVPCIKELPEFKRFAENRKHTKLKLIFVSLDFKSNYKKTLYPILKKQKMKDPIYLLDEPNADKWINEIDSSWSGSIPATLIVNNKKRWKQFITEPLIYEKLNLLIK
jgi:thiol-disulfide isomerase/thioredoxin